MPNVSQEYLDTTQAYIDTLKSVIDAQEARYAKLQELRDLEHERGELALKLLTKLGYTL